MANPPAFDGPRLLSWAQRSAAELERRRVEINQLNVFPVPDSDTGSNMAHTMAAAVRQAAELAPGASAAEVAEALAVGSMRGARGNSGVVLSQVIRGVAQSVGEAPLGGEAVAEALTSAVDFVDRAIAEPVEGTVVTVLRAAAEAAGAARSLGLEAVAAAASDAAREALARTPSQLPALREAGVVDAGGTGLAILLEQLVNEIAGRGGAVPVPLPDEDGQPAPYLEVMFFFDGHLDALEATLRELGGDSIAVARASETSGRVHVHSRRAGAVIEAAFAAGQVSGLRLEVLPDDDPAAGAGEAAPRRIIVALAPPGSVAEIFREAGALAVDAGEDPAGAVLEAIAGSRAREVIVLPNGLMGAEEIAEVERRAGVEPGALSVAPTVRLVNGIAALSVYEPEQPLASAAYTMAEAAGAMRTAVVQRTNGGISVATAAGVSVEGGSAAEVIALACERLLGQGGELVSILFDPDQVAAAEIAALGQPAAELRAHPADGLGVIAEIGVE
ncbi:DAK2 domain-containing protein [Corynebacterium liangguodongii]|uniref:Kinase n=1 Tax=Corynebacterium liangguodongii TaxID=2079535 RepID=A0A2S0WDU8_9CORY|nr:DAK2 domain-containing protein [Corynebacterium liangguodongii]AWB83904.1 kinase [Corynebacterium liangguodongii]PWB99043.1 DAK2 domain-containing protein [Corynebacterium liangguodongii]